MNLIFFIWLTILKRDHCLISWLVFAAVNKLVLDRTRMWSSKQVMHVFIEQNESVVESVIQVIHAALAIFRVIIIHFEPSQLGNNNNHKSM